MTYFQKLLRELMAEHDLTEIELACFTKIEQGKIANWLSDKSKPDYDSLKTLSHYFNVSADMLLDTRFDD